jgi:flagellin-like hook-associated protein FlgL
MLTNVLGSLASANKTLAASQLNLSTQKRINNVRDGQADYAIARRAESSIRNNKAGMENVQGMIDILSVEISFWQDLEADLIRLQDLTAQYGSATIDDDERIAIEAEAASLADKWSADASATNFMYNGFNLYDASVDLAVNGTGGGVSWTNEAEASAANAQASGAYIFTSGTTISTQSLGTVWDLTGVAGGTLVFDGTLAVGTVVLDSNLNEVAMQAARSELMRMAGMQDWLQTHNNVISVAVDSQDRLRGHYEDVDIAAETVRNTQATILQQIAIAQLAAANTASSQVLGLF